MLGKLSVAVNNIYLCYYNYIVVVVVAAAVVVINGHNKPE